ncbi:MAG: hypothetical protein HYT16_03590 [DPANN group archaeon]|nr:hypothetical protein [DPANN group archaeon]
MAHRVIAVSGLPGAGKSTTVKLLFDALSDRGCHFQKFNAGQMWRTMHQISGSSLGFEDWYGLRTKEENMAMDALQASFVKNNNTLLEARFSALVCRQLGLDYLGVFVSAPIDVRASRSGSSTGQLHARLADEERASKQIYGRSHTETSLYHIFVETINPPADVVAKILKNDAFIRYLQRAG